VFTVVAGYNGWEVDMSHELVQPLTEPIDQQSLAPRTSRLRLILRALLLDEGAYAAAVSAPKPFLWGLLTLLLLIAMVVVARLVGHGLGWLTSPQLDSIQMIIRNFVTGLPWYAGQLQQNPAFATQFTQGYALGWDGIRTVLGIPTVPGTAATIGLLVLSTLLAWFGFGTVAHWLARWFGGHARYGQTLGATALSYAPLLLLVVETVPGATVPLTLLFLWMLMGKYLALKNTHALTTGYTLSATLLPYLIGLVLFGAVALFGGAYGIDQIPYTNDALSALRAFPFLPQ